MIYSVKYFLLLLVSICFHVNGFLNFGSQLRSRLKSVPDWLQEGPTKFAEEEIIPTMVKVRFINTVNGKDIVVDVEEGSNLLFVGDEAGVKLPRACRTGLCGSCTCEIKDPAAIKTSSNPREGFATIRACSTKCYVPDGMDELVVDVHRMRKSVKSNAIDEDKSATELIASSYVSNSRLRPIYSTE